MTYEDIFNKLRGPMVGLEELCGLLDLVTQGHSLTEDSVLRLIRTIAANRIALPELFARCQAETVEACAKVADRCAADAIALEARAADRGDQEARSRWIGEIDASREIGDDIRALSPTAGAKEGT